MTPKAKATTKNRYIGHHQNEKSCTSKDITKKMKRESSEWCKIFKNHTSDIGHI